MLVDRDLASHDAELAERVAVIPGLDMRLAFIDAEAGEDKYQVLQGLRDGTTGEDPKCCYVYQRSGGTGTRGSISVDGPMEQPKAAKAIAQTFKEMTGQEWGSVEPGHRALPGKYWLQQAATPDEGAIWQYYLDDGVDGKQPGWYPYEQSASAEVEELYAQHVANEREERTATRHVHSGYFSYKIDLEAMTQQNTKTQKVRTLRRACGDEAQQGVGLGRKARAKKAGRAPRGAKVAPMRAAAKRAPKRAAMKGLTPKKKAMKRAMKKAMKKAMKVMKVMKKAKVKKAGSKALVLKGLREKTKGGLKAGDLMKSTSGKVVSKKMSAAGKRSFEQNHIGVWVAACKAARIELGLSGFVAVKKGTPFYDAVKARYDAARAAA